MAKKARLKMYRATTPKHTFTLPFSTDGIDVLLLTYKQKNTVLELTKEDVELEENKIIVNLTQEETKMFNANMTVSVQARIKMSTGEVIASNVLKVRVDPVLNDEVIA